MLCDLPDAGMLPDAVGDHHVRQQIGQTVAAQQIKNTRLQFAFDQMRHERQLVRENAQILCQRRFSVPRTLRHRLTVVNGHLRQHAAAQPVNAAVAKIAGIDLLRRKQERGHGRSHPAIRQRFTSRAYRIVHLAARLLQKGAWPHHIFLQPLLPGAQRSGRRERRSVSGLFAAHTVENGKAFLRVQQILRRQNPLQSAVILLQRAAVQIDIILISCPHSANIAAAGNGYLIHTLLSRFSIWSGCLRLPPLPAAFASYAGEPAGGIGPSLTLGQSAVVQANITVSFSCLYFFFVV